MKNYNIFFRPIEKNKEIYAWLLDIGGVDAIDLMIEKKKNATETYGWTRRVSKYLGIIMKEGSLGIKDVLFWLVECNQQAKSRIGIDVDYDKGSWIKCIKEGKSLPFGVKSHKLLLAKNISKAV